MKTFAVVTRIFAGEKPYINNFLDYYLNYLKIDRVYFFSNDHTNWDLIIDSRFKRHVKIDCYHTHIGKEGNIARNMDALDYMNNLYLNDIIREDYILNVDCDEYLYLNNQTLNEFTESYNTYDSIYINWVFFSSNNFDDLNPANVIRNTRGIENFVGKSLCKRQSILKIYDTNKKTMHRPLLKEGGSTIFLKSISTECYIIHLTSRNLRDTLIQEYYWTKGKSTKKFINKNLSNNNFNIYPSRFKVNKILLDFNRSFNTKDYNPIFHGFDFSHHFVKSFERELVKEFYGLFEEINERHVLYNMALDFHKNSKYMKDIELLEATPKNYYKETDFSNCATQNHIDQ